MPKTHAELVAALDTLEARIPVLIAETEPESLMEAFAGEAEMVEYGIGVG